MNFHSQLKFSSLTQIENERKTPETQTHDVIKSEDDCQHV